MDAVLGAGAVREAAVSVLEGLRHIQVVNLLFRRQLLEDGVIPVNFGVIRHGVLALFIVRRHRQDGLDVKDSVRVLGDQGVHHPRVGGAEALLVGKEAVHPHHQVDFSGGVAFAGLQDGYLAAVRQGDGSLCIEAVQVHPGAGKDGGVVHHVVELDALGDGIPHKEGVVKVAGGQPLPLRHLGVLGGVPAARVLGGIPLRRGLGALLRAAARRGRLLRGASLAPQGGGSGGGQGGGGERLQGGLVFHRVQQLPNPRPQQGDGRRAQQRHQKGAQAAPGFFWPVGRTFSFLHGFTLSFG